MSSFICKIQVKTYIYVHIPMTQEQERSIWREEEDTHEKKVGPNGGNEEQVLTKYNYLCL